MTPLFADQISDVVQPYIDKLPPLPKMPVFAEDIPAYVMVGIGIIVLFVALIRLLRLRIFRAVFALISVALVSYYPLAYGFHYWWFNYHAAEVADPPESWEDYVINHWDMVDYGTMAAGGIVGLLLLLITKVPKAKKSYAAEEAAGQPGQPGRPGQPKNPFEFK